MCRVTTEVCGVVERRNAQGVLLRVVLELVIADESDEETVMMMMMVEEWMMCLYGVLDTKCDTECDTKWGRWQMGTWSLEMGNVESGMGWMGG